MDSAIQLIIALIVTLPVSLFFALIGARALRRNHEVTGTFLLALSTEIAGALVVFLLLDTVGAAIGQNVRDLIEDSQDEIQEQIREDAQIGLESEMRVGSNESALIALEELRTRDWLYDGTMQNWNLSGADLSDAFFYRAWLGGADFSYANLTGAQLGAATLTGADFTGADLTCAYLLDAQLDGALFDGTTILPDGTPWAPGRDLSWFTRPEGYGAYAGPPTCGQDNDQDGIPNTRDDCINEGIGAAGLEPNGCPAVSG